MIYVTDTHPLLWFLLKDKKLSKEAKELFEMAESGRLTIIVPPIVLLELMYVLEKASLMEKFNEIIEELEGVSNYEIFPLDLDVVKIVSKIQSIRELHDRIIVATSKVLDCKLITKDEKVTESKEVECIW